MMMTLCGLRPLSSAKKSTYLSSTEADDTFSVSRSLFFVEKEGDIPDPIKHDDANNRH